MNKSKIEEMLATKPVRKGQPLGLSTEEVIDDSTPSHHRTIAPKPEVKRTKRGYALRDDLVKACKQIALDTDRTLYEVMEEAISEYLERRKTE